MAIAKNDPLMEEMKELLDSFDDVELEAMTILGKALVDGEAHKTAIQKAADFFRKAGRESAAKELLEYGEQWEKEHS